MGCLCRLIVLERQLLRGHGATATRIERFGALRTSVLLERNYSRHGVSESMEIRLLLRRFFRPYRIMRPSPAARTPPAKTLPQTAAIPSQKLGREQPRPPGS